MKLEQYDLERYINSGKSLLATKQAVRIAKNEHDLFFYTTFSHLPTLLRLVFANVAGDSSVPLSGPAKRVKIEVPQEIKGRELSTEEQTLLKVRERFDFFKNLSENEVLTVAREVRMMRLSKEEMLFDQGDAGDEAFFIVRGEVSIQIAKEDGEYMEVAKLGSETIFGELAPITREPRTAKAMAAIEGTTVLGFKINEGITDQSAAAMAKFYHNVTMILADKLIAANKKMAQSRR